MSSKYFIFTGLNGASEIIRQDDDGVVWTLGLGEQDAGYLAWVAEGNTPEEWSLNGN
jgi:hypothetical protein